MFTEWLDNVVLQLLNEIRTKNRLKKSLEHILYTCPTKHTYTEALMHICRITWVDFVWIWNANGKQDYQNTIHKTLNFHVAYLNHKIPFFFLQLKNTLLWAYFIFCDHFFPIYRVTIIQLYNKHRDIYNVGLTGSWVCTSTVYN